MTSQAELRTIVLVGVIAVLTSVPSGAQRGGSRGGQRGSAPVASPGGSAGRPAPAGKPSGGSVDAHPGGDRTSPAQQANLEALQSDLASLKAGSQVTQQQKDDLKSSLMAMADGATKPDPAAVQALANDLSAALVDGNLSTAEKVRLSQDLETVMNSANVPPADVQAAIADAQQILTASGVDRSDVQAIAADLQAIANEAQANAPVPEGTPAAITSPRTRRGR
jgi:hypothetical protein